VFGYARGSASPRSRCGMNILCVTPNPAVDRTLVVPGFVAGRVWRASRVHAACGGKGVNVARALAALGTNARCLGPLGGGTGDFVAAAALAEGLQAVWTRIAGETRTSVIIVGDGGEATVINEPGPVLSPEEWARLVALVAAEAQAADAVCISGSLPPGCPPGGAGRLVAAAAAQHRPVWVDASGDPLAAAVAAAPFGVKINAEEASALLGRPFVTASGAPQAARAILARGPRRAVVTLGAGGAVLADEEGCWRAHAPAIAAVNPVGSGDAFLAGLLKGFAEGRGCADALRLAVACGAANALRQRERAGDLDPATVTDLAGGIEVWRVH
jgi:1-phosphofructokinase family hexose kinase